MVSGTFTAAGQAATGFPDTVEGIDALFARHFEGGLTRHADREGVSLYTNVRAQTMAETRLSRVRQELQSLSNDALYKLGHFQTVRGILATGAHIVADRRQKNALYGSETFDRAARLQEMTGHFKAMKAQGVNEADLRFLLNNVKIWLTITPHPTKDKNANGRGALRHLIMLADEHQPDKRDEELRNDIRKMLNNRLTPERKDTLEDESADARKVQLRYNRGMLDFLEDLDDALRAAGYKIELADEQSQIDVAMRDWFTGDADGKDVPAPVMFNKRVQDAIWALEENIEILGGDREDESIARGGKFGAHLATYWQIKKNLLSLQQSAANIEEVGAPSEVFDKALEAFGQAFRTAIFNGGVFDSGPKLTKAMRDKLRDMIAGVNLSDNEKLSDAEKKQARRVLLRHNQLGLSMGKQEIRHNSKDLMVIFDNLYAYLKTQHKDFIVKNHFLMGEFARAENKGFSGWPHDRQIEFLVRVQKEFGQDGLKDILQKANQHNPAAQAVLQRFRAYKALFNAKRRGIAIIAESQPMSPVYQQILAEAFGIKNMVHCPLNEDKEAIIDALKNMEFYVDNMLHQHQQEAEHELAEQGQTLADIYMVVMDPQSDSQKGLSLFIKPTQHLLRWKTIQLSNRRRLPILLKKGTGASYARGGYSPNVEPRQFIATLVEGMPHAFKNGFFQGNKEKRRMLMRLGAFVSVTIQGRDMGLRLGRPQVCYDMIHGIFSEIMGAGLVLMGRAKPEHVTAMPSRFSKSMTRFMQETDAEAIKLYEHLRADESKEKPDTHILDNYMEAIGAPYIAEHAGVGARKPARAGAGKGKPKPATELRAIGSNILHEFGLTFHDGYYPIGHWMSAVHDAYNNRQIDRQDLLALKDDEFRMRQMFSNAFAALAAADLEHGFDTLFPGQDWTVGKVLDAVQSDYKGLSENQALHVRIAYDALLSASMMEALLTTGKEDDCVFDADRFDIIRRLYAEDDRLNTLKFGPRTKEFYPHIRDIQKMERERRLSRALIHEAQRRVNEGLLDPDNAQDKSLLHHIASSARIQGPYNMGNLLDKPGSAFGARPEPVLRRIMNFWKSGHAVNANPAMRTEVP
ncbi:MAG: hypothetical protein L6Q57_00950 [Alphaproteobacteria bacterium]|nr:hypothetical protein [Alphaproteobacteria bacterium]